MCCWSCNNEYDLALLSGNNEYELVLLVTMSMRHPLICVIEFD